LLWNRIFLEFDLFERVRRYKMVVRVAGRGLTQVGKVFQFGALTKTSRYNSISRLNASVPSKLKCSNVQSSLFVQNSGFSTSTLAPDSERVSYHYSDGYLTNILGEVKTIAVVGASANWKRPSYFASKYLQKKGYRVIPVNPGVAAKNGFILGEKCYASISEIPDKIDMVDIFRASDAALGICEEAVRVSKEKGIKTVWMQLGVINEEARDLCESNGMKVVMDRCPKIEYSRLFGELGWHGFDSGIINSKRQRKGKLSISSESNDGVQFTGFETKCIHAGTRPDAETGARVTPIYQNASYVFEDVDDAASLFNLQSFGNIYSRLSNPTVAALEEKLAALEGGVGATCTASGHSAQLLILFTLLQPGDRFVASRNLYGGSITQFKKMGEKFGWHVDFVDLDDHSVLRDKLSHPRCKLLWAESLANPGGIVSDLKFLSEETKRVQVPLIIDNTMATPYLCQPKEFGADIVVHSTTKFLSGHGNSLGGCVVDLGTFDFAKVPEKYPSLTTPEPAYHGLVFWETFGPLALTVNLHAVGLRDLGPSMAPMNVFLTICGVETLGVRMDRHVENARRVAEYLENHPKVSWVSYAGLGSSHFHHRAKEYMPKGPGSVFTFGLNGGFEEGVRFVESCQLLSHLANIGDTRSLVLHPGSTTHRQLSDEARVAAGAGDEVIRLSVGLESVNDIVKDLSQALAKI